MNKKFHIKKGERYWQKGDTGYTYNRAMAKEFTEEKATEIINRPNSDKTMHLIE